MLCYNCFKKIDNDFDICPYCGSVKCDTPLEPIHLAPGTILQNRYLLGQAVGAGGFGIIYKAYDTKLETVIAVKEFFSPKLMTRAAGESAVIISKKNEAEFVYRKDRFLAEARNMAKFGDHRSIPNVFEFFEENGTAYIVMELLNGTGLNMMMSAEGGKIEQDFALHVINEVGQALISLHKKGIIHRDVAPDNVFISSERDLKVKLLDLGAAKLSSDDDTVMDIILKPGYSPTEQYDSTGAIGPWSDVYALGATLYVMLTGIKPDESTDRKKEDLLLPPCEIDSSISENLSNAVMKAMALDRHMRFKSVDDFLKAINGEKRVLTLAKEKKKRRRNQLLGIVAAVLVLVGVGGKLALNYNDMKAEQNLEEADITIWYCAEDNSNEAFAMEYIINDFKTKFPVLNIELSRFSESDYDAILEEAYAKGELPSVFESTGVASEIVEGAFSFDDLLSQEQALKCNFLIDKYKNEYPESKKIPIGFETPVAVVITGGTVYTKFESTVFASIEDFSDCKVAFDSEKAEILSKCFEINSYDENDFGTEDGQCAVLITTTENMSKYKERLMANEWHYAYLDSLPVFFDYEWSIGNGTEREVNASKRLVSWMLGNVYQNALMVSWAQDGQIPLSIKCFDEMSALSDDYEGLASIIGGNK